MLTIVQRVDLAIALDQRKLDLGEILLTHTKSCLDTGLHIPKLLTLQDIMKERKKN